MANNKKPTLHLPKKVVRKKDGIPTETKISRQANPAEKPVSILGGVQGAFESGELDKPTALKTNTSAATPRVQLMGQTERKDPRFNTLVEVPAIQPKVDANAEVVFESKGRYCFV